MAVDKMSQCSGTSQVLVPLTSSMYVPGEIEDKDKLLVDIGAAYYAEKDCKGATKYLQRKQVKLKIECKSIDWNQREESNLSKKRRVSIK